MMELAQKTKTDKIVTFSSKLQKVHYLYTWDYAYRQARISKYEHMILDRIQFENRIKIANRIIGPVLLKKIEHL